MQPVSQKRCQVAVQGPRLLILLLLDSTTGSQDLAKALDARTPPLRRSVVAAMGAMIGGHYKSQGIDWERWVEERCRLPGLSSVIRVSFQKGFSSLFRSLLSLTLHTYLRNTCTSTTFHQRTQQHSTLSTLHKQTPLRQPSRSHFSPRSDRPPISQLLSFLASSHLRLTTPSLPP